MRIAICASEGAPYAKSGGLGDVMEALPAALSRIEGNDVALFLPYYSKIKDNTAYETEKVAEFRVSLGWRQQYCAVMKLTNRADKVQVYFLDNEYYFGGRTGAIYGDMDDGERFAFFSRACLDAMVAVDFIPDVIQCNDWQCALIPTYLKAVYHAQFPKTRCMYTIHNIEYQGWANASFFDDMLGLPWEYRGTLDMNNSVNVMKGAIETADLVTTVSETYARELMYPYYAHGLDGILSENAWKLTGITNGIDTGVFNPETDKALGYHYNADSFVEGKAAVKAALQEEVGLRGAKAAAWSIAPDVGIAVDVTDTGDAPCAPEVGRMAVKVGAGPTIKYKDSSLLCNPQVIAHLIKSAKKAGVAYQNEVLVAGGTDAGAMQRSRGGVLSGAVSLPCRNIHNPGEVVSLSDLEGAAKLIAAAAELEF